MIAVLITLAATIVGAVLGSLLACIPALHVYNVIALMVVALHLIGGSGAHVPAEALVPCVAGMLSGWCMASTIPSVLLAAPDESAVLTVLPGQKYAMLGRGFEATLLTAAGGLAGALLLVLTGGPLLPRVMPAARAILNPHSHWILWAVIAFLLMSEWPKTGTGGQGGWRKFAYGWMTPGAGLLTFLLAGILGFILRYRSPISVDAAFQNLMPAFAGLFAVPWLALNIVSRAELPPQRAPAIAVQKGIFLKGVAAGAMGGAFSAFFPGITGGIGGLLAGHATAQRDERVFMVSQGASRAIYYLGAFLLYFLPGQRIVRGSLASILSGIYTPRTWYDYYMVLASIAVGSAAAFILVVSLARGMVGLVDRFGYRRISSISLALVVALVFVATGPMGMAALAAATGIGLIPVLFHSRRINCLGVILLPMACGMSGVGGQVARLLGLL